MTDSVYSDIINHLQQYWDIYLVLSPFVAVILFFTIRALLKFLKGTIKVQLLKKTYSYGEVISGFFFLNAKKMIRGEDLNVHIVIHKTTTRTVNGKRKTSTTEFKRFTHHIESGVTYEPGLKREYPINIKLPTSQEIFGNTQNDLPESLSGGILGEVIKYGMKYTKSKTRYSFKVLVDLQAEGIDISGSKKISVVNDIGVDTESEYPRDVI